MSRGPCGPVRILRHGVSTSRTPSCSSSTCVPCIAPPAILISGSLLAEAKEEALANGAFAFIPKPVDLAEFDRFVLLAIESRKANR